ETSRGPASGNIKPFCLRFSDLSPYAVMEILDLSDAQQERFLKAYDTLKLVLKDLEIFPKRGEEKLALEIDEMESGCPRMSLLQLIDVAGIFSDLAAHGKEDKGGVKIADAQRAFDTLSPELRGKEAQIRQRAVGARAP